MKRDQSNQDYDRPNSGTTHFQLRDLRQTDATLLLAQGVHPRSGSGMPTSR
jgi:hypothetical protein